MKFLMRIYLKNKKIFDIFDVKQPEIVIILFLLKVKMNVVKIF